MCGNSCFVKTSHLLSGHTKSCGCSRYTEQKHPNRKRLSATLLRDKKLLRDYRKGAKKRGLSWELPIEIFFGLTKKSCTYCSQAPDPVNGVDRVDSSLGYMVENCVPCCGPCNRMKMAMPLSEFIERVKRIFNNADKIEKDRQELSL